MSLWDQGVGLSRFIVPGWLCSHYNTQSGVPLMHRTHTQTHTDHHYWSYSIELWAQPELVPNTNVQILYTTYKCHAPLDGLLKLCYWAHPVMSVWNTHISTNTLPTYSQSSCGDCWKKTAAICRPLWSALQSLGCSDWPGSPPWCWYSRSYPEDTSSDVHLIQWEEQKTGH